MNSGIYSLVAIDPITEKKVVIELTNRKENRYKVNISYIDKLTTYFKDEETLAQRLYDRKYIDFKNAKLYVEYTYAKKLNRLEVLYKPYEKYRELITNSESTIEVNNQLFIQAFDNIFNELNDPELKKYILNSNINLKIKEYIDLYYNSKTLEDAYYYKLKIITILTNYRIFRDLTVLIKNYHNKKIMLKSVEIEEVEENSDDEFLTEEDFNMDYYPYNKRQ